MQKTGRHFYVIDISENISSFVAIKTINKNLIKNMLEKLRNKKILGV